jgi:hypothetical protein
VDGKTIMLLQHVALRELTVADRQDSPRASAQNPESQSLRI